MIRVDIFESLIDVHALENPSSIAVAFGFPCLNSSFILSKIKMFASTAIPIERIKPAIPERVRVIPYGVIELNLNSPRTKSVYKVKATLAIIPSLPYKTVIKITIIIKPNPPAKRLFAKDTLPRVG